MGAAGMCCLVDMPPGTGLTFQLDLCCQQVRIVRGAILGFDPAGRGHYAWTRRKAPFGPLSRHFENPEFLGALIRRSMSTFICPQCGH